MLLRVMRDYNENRFIHTDFRNCSPLKTSYRCTLLEIFIMKVLFYLKLLSIMYTIYKAIHFWYAKFNALAIYIHCGKLNFQIM